MSDVARFVIKVGGSVLAPDGPETEYIQLLAGVLHELAKGTELYVVVGGGKMARRYIQGARTLGASESYCDEIAIGITRANARLLIAALGEDALREPARALSELGVAGASGKIVVMGGTVPGHTTDAVAALAAEYISADGLVLCKDVGGVYTADPKKNPEASFIPSLSGARLVEIVSDMEAVAGISTVTDLVAAKVIKRSSLRTYVVDGRNTDNIIAAVRGKDCQGTKIN